MSSSLDVPLCLFHSGTCSFTKNCSTVNVFWGCEKFSEIVHLLCPPCIHTSCFWCDTFIVIYGPEIWWMQWPSYLWAISVMVCINKSWLLCTCATFQILVALKPLRIGSTLIQHFPFGMTSGVTSWRYDIKLCDTLYDIGSEIDNFLQCMIKINVTLCCT